MRILSRAKDGGPLSRVWGYWLFEIKRLASVALLRFEDGTRESFHSHAFNSVSWILRGRLVETHLDGHIEEYPAGIWPVVTRRETFHRVSSEGTTWVLTFRGPWWKFWMEFDPVDGGFSTLTDGRREIG